MIIVGLGSNWENAAGWLRRAVGAIKREPGVRILRASPIYASDPLWPPGFDPAQASEAWLRPYLNLALALETKESSPLQFLSTLKRIEKNLGRKARERWAPREIDLDLLDWNGLSMSDENQSELCLPHPGLAARPFALLPLMDVCPDWAHHQIPDARERVSKWREAGGQGTPFHTRRTSIRLTEIVGILNLSPDSFSSEGHAPSGALEVNGLAKTLVEAGASVIDVGAESTRPGAHALTHAEEWERLCPALAALHLPDGVRLSVDTRHPETAARLLAAEHGGIPVDWINDVGGLSLPAMRELARTSSATFVAMHSLGVPPTRERTLDSRESPVEQLLRWGRAKIAELEDGGVSRERLILDPGIGFGKTPLQNLALLREAWRLHEVGVPILVGHSRKSFLSGLWEMPKAKTDGNALASVPAHARDLETALLSALLADQGIEYLRVHDPSTQSRALQLASAWDGVCAYSQDRLSAKDYP